LFVRVSADLVRIPGVRQPGRKARVHSRRLPEGRAPGKARVNPSRCLCFPAYLPIRTSGAFLFVREVRRRQTAISCKGQAPVVVFCARFFPNRIMDD
ncbi:hypothetical protein, partial [Alteromonas halophila]|uniref:hypothetical protein n=1 Tax=Alteromonas halophila TaxID=516698 RepID=UPI001E506DCF